MRDHLTSFDGIGVEESSSTCNDIALFASVGARSGPPFMNRDQRQGCESQGGRAPMESLRRRPR